MVCCIDNTILLRVFFLILMIRLNGLMPMTNLFTLLATSTLISSNLKAAIYAHNFLLSLQSYSFIPLIDKPTPVYGNSATLIDNILVNNATNLLSSGNIISDISDHFSQFCVMSNILMKTYVAGLKKVRDFSHFTEAKFLSEVSAINWNEIISPPNINTDKLLSRFYNMFNKVINTHVPFKTVSKRRAKQLSKPWITKGIRKSIKIKNSLYHSNFAHQYTLYRNKITTLIRLSKKQLFS